jgi:ribosomal protein S18 acetylase RimI-like enzyme
MEITYKDFNILSENQVKALYEDLGWSSYTKNIKKLLSGIQNSSFVYSAWDKNTLVGLIRVLSDGHTIAYIQDILVKKNYQGQGVGKHLMEAALKKYKTVRQIVLTTDITGPGDFYQKFGFKEVKEYDCKTYLKIQGDNDNE